MTRRLETTVDTDLGPFRVAECDGAIVRIAWGQGEAQLSPLLEEAARQLRAYANQRLRSFDLPLAADGSAFERSVWDEMLKIPYGETRSYGDLAAALGAMPQAVGAACGANPIPIVIPCHRVIASGGEIGGFSGGQGIETKRELLVHEGAIAEQLSFF